MKTLERDNNYLLFLALGSLGAIHFWTWVSALAAPDLLKFEVLPSLITCEALAATTLPVTLLLHFCANALALADLLLGEIDGAFMFFAAIRATLADVRLVTIFL